MTNMLHSRSLQRGLGKVLAHYFKFVAKTSPLVTDMEPHYQSVETHGPVIFTFWHGEQFMLPSILGERVRMRALVSRHGDGEIQAAALETFGVEPVRGSGGRNRAKILKKGGIQGSMELLSSLDEGFHVGITANIPRGPAREVGKGVVTLAKLSGRPIFPVALVTKRVWTLNSWDKAAINMPFSRAAFGLAGPIWVKPGSDDAQLETVRKTVEDELARITQEAHNSARRN